jgi:hypothetical protein
MSNALVPAFEKSLKDSFQQSLVPKIEKGVAAMMTQIHEVLDQGIRDLLRSQSTSFEKYQQPFFDKMQSDLDTIGLNLSKSLSISSLEGFFSPDGMFHSLLSDMISKEIKNAFVVPPLMGHFTQRTSSSSIMSPLEVKQIDLKAEIDHDMENGAYEKAFTAALGSTDLSNVLVRRLFLFSSICVSQLIQRLYLKAVK